MKVGYSLLLLLGVSYVVSKPAPTTKPPPLTEEDNGAPPAESLDEPLGDTGLYYDQYLQKVVKLLESDELFRKTMEGANFDDIRDGKLSEQVHKIPTEIRRQLDEVKREEITRLRKIAHAKMQVDNGQKLRNTNYLKDIASHLDANNAHSFGAEDLTNLIKAATKDLENYDEKRHKDFKNYEMNKEIRRQEKLKQMDQANREKAEKEYLEMRKKHEDHPAMNHPGSKAQLQEVWDEEDGLDGQAFNPKTFFSMHDINSDQFLDPMELEALFEKDLAKAYDPNNPEDDMFQMEEERRRMREHVMKEVDYNNDGLISYDEFHKYTNSRDFEKPDENSYKTVDEMIDNDELYTKDELQEFRDMIEQQENELKEKLDELRKKAQGIVKMKTQVHQQEMELNLNGIATDESNAVLKNKHEEIKKSEEMLKEMHAELKQQSKEIMELKEELQKQEEQQRDDGKPHPGQEDESAPGEPHLEQPQEGQQQFQQT